MSRQTQPVQQSDPERLAQAKNPQISKVVSKVLQDDELDAYPSLIYLEVITEKEKMPKEIVTVTLRQFFEVREKDVANLIQQFEYSSLYDKYLNAKEQGHFRTAKMLMIQESNDPYRGKQKIRYNQQQPTKFSQGSSLENSFEKLRQGSIDRGTIEEIGKTSKTSFDFPNAAQQKVSFVNQKLVDQFNNLVNLQSRSNQSSEQKSKNKSFQTEEKVDIRQIYDIHDLFEDAVQFKKNEGKIIHEKKGNSKNDLLVFQNYDLVPQIHKISDKVYQKTQQQPVIEHFMTACNNAMGTEVYHDLDFFTIILALAHQMNNSEMIDQIEQFQNINLNVLEGIFFDGEDLHPYKLKMMHAFEQKVSDKSRWYSFNKIIKEYKHSHKNTDIGKAFFIDTQGAYSQSQKDKKNRFQHFFILKQNEQGKYKLYPSLRDNQQSFLQNPQTILEELYSQNNKFIKHVNAVRFYHFEKYDAKYALPLPVLIQKMLLKKAINRYSEDLDNLIQSMFDKFDQQIRQRSNQQINEDKNQDIDDLIDITDIEIRDQEKQQELPQNYNQEEMPYGNVFHQNPIHDKNDDIDKLTPETLHEKQIMEQLRILVNDTDKTIQENCIEYLSIFYQNVKHLLDLEESNLKSVEVDFLKVAGESKDLKRLSDEAYKEFSKYKKIKESYMKSKMYMEFEAKHQNYIQNDGHIKRLQRLRHDKFKEVKRLENKINDIKSTIKMLGGKFKQTDKQDPKDSSKLDSQSWSDQASNQKENSQILNEQSQPEPNLKDISQQRQQDHSQNQKITKQLQKPAVDYQSQQSQNQQKEQNRLEFQSTPQFTQKKVNQQAQTTGQNIDKEKKRDNKTTVKMSKKDEKINQTLSQDQRQNNPQGQRNSFYDKELHQFTSPYKISTENTDNSRQTVLSQQTVTDNSQNFNSLKRTYSQANTKELIQDPKKQQPQRKDMLSEIPSMFDQEDDEEKDEEDNEEEKEHVHYQNQFGKNKERAQINQRRKYYEQSEEEDLFIDQEEEEENNEHQRENQTTNTRISQKGQVQPASILQHYVIDVDLVQVKESDSQEVLTRNQNQEAEKIDLQRNAPKVQKSQVEQEKESPNLTWSQHSQKNNPDGNQIRYKKK